MARLELTAVANSVNAVISKIDEPPVNKNATGRAVINPAKKPLSENALPGIHGNSDGEIIAPAKIPVKSNRVDAKPLSRAAETE